MFKNKDIEIAVCEGYQNEEDETAYLLKSEENRERLLKAIENVDQNRNLVTVFGMKKRTKKNKKEQKRIFMTFRRRKIQ